MSTVGSGWLSTKKRGKDDVQIAQDSRLAQERKKRKRNNRNPSIGIITTKKKGGGRKKRSYGDDDDYEEDCCDDNFIVDDEEDDELIEDSEVSYDSKIDQDDDDDDEDSIVLHDDDSSDSDIEVTNVVHTTKSSRSSRVSCRGKIKNDERKDTESVDTLSSDESNEEDSFLPQADARRSAPSKLLKRNSDVAKKQSNSTLNSNLLMNAKKKKEKKTADSLMRLKPPPEVTDKGKSTNNDDVIRPCLSKSKVKTEFKEIFSSDEEIRADTNNETRTTDMNSKSKYFPSKTEKFFAQEDENSVDEEERSTEQLWPQDKNDLNHCLKDTPEHTKEGKRRRLKKKINKVKPAKSTKRVRSNNKSSSDEDQLCVSGDDDDDDDDDIGFSKENLKVALEKSLMDNLSKIGSNEKDLEIILEDSSSDDEDECQGDDYFDHEKETATNILRTAEQLSSYVVRAMSKWFENDKDNSPGPIQGIIADGAVSLGNLDIKEFGSDDSDHKWISNSEMRTACPNVTLSQYQLIAVNWLALLNGMTVDVGKNVKNVNGVLADEMGLGKTVQTIAFMAWLKYRRQSSVIDVDNYKKSEVTECLPHLIVVPVSTLPNWVREFEKFCPEMKVFKYHGSQKEREEMKDNLKTTSSDELDVIIAPVSYFQQENSPDRKFLSRFKYDYLVVDEAHNLKNSKSTRYKMLDRVKTDHRLLLTGTPIQNNPQELLNMLSFIMPLFSSAATSFDERDNCTEQMLKHFVDEKVENGDEQIAYRKLKQLFAPFVLRRKKSDVISQLLPKKERKTIFVNLSDETRAIYQSVISSHLKRNGKNLNPSLGEHLFTNLRKCAHHPLLLRNRWKSAIEIEHLTDSFYKYGAFKGEGSTKERVGEEIASWNDFNIHLTALDLINENIHRGKDLDRYILKEDSLFQSAKFESLRSLLPNLIAENHRILIFSSWTSCLDLLGCLMDYLNIKFQRMDGSFASAERQMLIDRFNNDKSYSVFLLSTKACGLGINLTSADTCIIHDLDFNPFNDLQAEDRCHRIGQKLQVSVYKLVTRFTVDEDIYKMQEKKAKMNAAIMDSASSSRKDKNDILKAVLTKATNL